MSKQYYRDGYGKTRDEIPKTRIDRVHVSMAVFSRMTQMSVMMPDQHGMGSRPRLLARCEGRIGYLDLSGLPAREACLMLARALEHALEGQLEQSRPAEAPAPPEGVTGAVVLFHDVPLPGLE